MRTLLCGVLLLVVAAALPTVAVAYPITVTISTVASGSLGSTSFSNEMVTVQAFFTTELTGCLVCTYQNGFASVSTISGLTASVTVAGLGTYENPTNVLANVSPGSLSVYDVEGRLGLNVESPAITATNFFTPSFGPITGSTIKPERCLPFACPPHMFTTAGDLVLTSMADTATGEVQASSPVPEPGTLGMIVTGLLGLSGFLPRSR